MSAPTGWSTPVGVSSRPVACSKTTSTLLVAIHRGPARARVRVRTVNIAEGCFVRNSAAPRVIGCFPDEYAAMRLGCAVVIRASGRWCRLLINDRERHQLKLLRAELDSTHASDRRARP
ncbi:MAG TPA: hypothetical protein VE442_13585 [Jatrophihabitans sp.]|jgi:transposase-like protein|nr:hypothetical protein [Jatrophihabitans sp.]